MQRLRIKLSVFNDVVISISRQVDYDLMDDPELYSWSVEERIYMGIREQAYRISREFGWTIEGGRLDA